LGLVLGLLVTKNWQLSGRPRQTSICRGSSTTWIRNDDFFNQPPVAINDSFLVFHDRPTFVSAAYGVLKNDYDPNGDTLEVYSHFNGRYGQVGMSRDGSFSYTPHSASPGGSDAFDYVVADPAGFQVTGHVDLLIV
jgi:hypothetical protein